MTIEIVLFERKYNLSTGKWEKDLSKTRSKTVETGRDAEIFFLDITHGEKVGSSGNSGKKKKTGATATKKIVKQPKKHQLEQQQQKQQQKKKKNK